MADKLRAIKLLRDEDKRVKLVCVYRQGGKRVVKAHTLEPGQKIRDLLTAIGDLTPQ